jgi:spore coat protein CotF
MAKNREMLKEAIAEAKAVKEMAIANAKAALEEAFTPQLKSMLSMKLQEMEMEEGDIYEYSEEHEDPTTGKRVTASDVTEDDGMNEIDLEELLAELELEEGKDDTLNEAEEEGEEEEGEEGEEEEGEEGDMEMEDLSDDEMKKMIEDVIAQMIKDGELEAGPEFGDEEEGEEMEMGTEEEEEEDVDLAELLREIEEMEEGMYGEAEEPVEEINFGKVGKAFSNVKKFFTGDKENDLLKFLQKNKIENAEEVVAQIQSSSTPKEKTDILKTVLGSNYGQPRSGSTGDISSFRYHLGMMNPEEKKDYESRLSSGAGSNPLGKLSETDKMKDDLEEAMKTIKTLRSELNEINLLNAKLLYTNKIFKAKNLNENQKVKVLSSFDKANNVGEVKMVYETLNEGIKVAKTTIKENLGRASKSTITPTAKQPIVESNDVFKRMQKLAGII